MTNREKAIIMAHTGICMLTGDKLNFFYNYLEELLGRPVYTQELAYAYLWETIKEKSKTDFLSLCEEDEETQEEFNDDYFSYNPFTEKYGWDC